MSRPLKLKVSGTVLCSVFQLPDHGFIGSLRGRTADVSLCELDELSLSSWLKSKALSIHNRIKRFPLFVVGIETLFRYAVTRTAIEAWKNDW